MRATSRDRTALVLLWATVSLPALVFLWGRVSGDVAFVLYREPKLIAIQLLGWALLTWLAWRPPPELDPTALGHTLRQAPVGLLVLFVAWAAVTAGWVQVLANARYELVQWALLVPMVVALAAWARAQPRVTDTIETALITSLGVATAVAGVQAAFPDLLRPWLSPIVLEGGIGHPSTFGYKNPMALALLGQLFLLAGRVAHPASGGSPARRLGLTALLVAECGLLVSLRSRSALLGAAAGIGVLAFLALVCRDRPRPDRRRTQQTAVAVALLIAVSGLVISRDDSVRSRLGSMIDMVRSPTVYLESDRGIYLQNTWQMVRHNPLGVGLGDWQTQYPVYRAHGRDRWFDDTVQVRRAHNDHAQVWGETGWPGLLLWAALWLATLIVVWRRFRAGQEPRLGFLLAQIVALLAAMATDYYVETPYGKFQLVLLLGLAIGRRGDEAPDPDSTAPTALATRPVVAIALPITVTVLALIQGGSMVALGDKLLRAGRTVAILRVLASAPAAPDTARRLAEVVLEADPLLRRPGHHKRLFRDHLAVAEAASATDLPTRARLHALAALDRQPFHPPVLRLMSQIEATHDSEAAAAWQEAHAYVRDQATAGFHRPYPRRPSFP